jgi:3-keto-5-aminohexanoate cleavage enzyme
MYMPSKNKILVQAALTGEQPLREGGPNVPVTPEAIAEEAYSCYKAGASMVHIHARDPETKLLTHDVSVFNDIMRRIRKKCDVLIQITGAIGGKMDPSTGKKVHFTEEQRMGLLDVTPIPDSIPLPMGTMDLTGPDGRSNTIFNSYEFLKTIIPLIRKKGMVLEMEIYDTSFLDNAVRLAEEGIIDKNGPIWLHYCFGDHNSVQPATPRQMVYVSDEGKRAFPQAVWEVGPRSKNHYNLVALGVALGCDIVRTGFEDNYHLPNGQMAKSNVEMVEAVIRIIRDMGRNMATVEEAKKIIGMQ